MNDILKLIEANEVENIEKWINTLDSVSSSEILNNRLFIAEKLYSVAFSVNPSNLIFAQLTVELYEKIFQINPPSESVLFSSLYIRLRVLKETQFSNAYEFFDSSVILDSIRRKLDVPIKKIQEMAVDWRSLDIKRIKELRSYKLWLKLLLEFEIVTEKEYSEFDLWKRLLSVLP